MIAPPWTTQNTFLDTSGRLAHGARFVEPFTNP